MHKHKLNRTKIAKGLAQLTLLVSSVYGLRQLLESVSDTLAFVVAGVFVLLISHIVFED